MNAFLTFKLNDESQLSLESGKIPRSELAAFRFQSSAWTLACCDALAKSQQALQQLEDALRSLQASRSHRIIRKP
jgi:hypothetical protein